MRYNLGQLQGFDFASQVGATMSRKRLFLLALFALTLTITTRFAYSQDAAELVTMKQQIPSGYKTYSLFLVCNPQWLDPSKNTGLFQLYQQFQNFGRAIGDDHVAIWFWKSNSYDRKDATLAKIVDVERSVRFCQAWKLTPSEGPHLVITSTYPDEAKLSAGLPPDTAVYKLGDMNPPDISKLLAKLTDQLIATGKVAPPAPAGGTPAAEPPPLPSLWLRLLTATQQTINSFGCAWSFKIDAGPVSADLKSCKPS